MSTPLSDRLETFMESAIEDALDEYERAHPDYGLERAKENRLFEGLEHFFAACREEDCSPLYSMAKEYFGLMNSNRYTDMKILYMRGYWDCVRIAEQFGWTLADG